MAIGHTFSGDHGPVAVMQNGRQIAGAVKAQASGTGRVEMDSIYNSGLPSVTVHGEGKQDKLEGTNLFDISAEPYEKRFDYILDIKTGLLKSNKTVLPYKPIRIYVNVPKNMDLEFSLDEINVDGAVELSNFGEPGERLVYTIEGNVKSKRISTGQYNRLTISVFNEIEKEIYVKGIRLTKNPTPYEPYCGGIPAPNPSYPIEPVFLEGASITDGTNTAPLPILRALPDGSVRDEIDVVSGTVVRRIGEIVLDGTENYGYSYFPTVTITKHFQPGEVWSSRKIHGVCNYGVKNIEWAEKTLTVLAFYKCPEWWGIETGEEFKQMVIEKYKSGVPITIWYALKDPIIEHYDPAILRQHPGYTQLIQQGGFREAEIEAEYWKEM